MNKWLSRISLRLRLTLLTTGIIVAVAAALTMASINRADHMLISSTIALTNINTAVQQPMVDGENRPIEQVTMTWPLTEVNDMQSVPSQEIILAKKHAEPLTKTVESESNGVLMPKQGTANGEAASAAAYTLQAKRGFVTSSTWTMLIVIVVGIVLTWLIAGRALKPVRSLATTVGEINAHNLSTRVEGFQASDEISRLADNFNLMLDKLESAFVQQKNFSVNAAHELKTPLAAIRANIEVLNMEEKPTNADYRETLETVQRNTERLIGLVDDLLRLNCTQQNFYSEALSTEDLLTEILTELQPAIIEKRLQVRVSNELPIVYGNSSLLHSAILNLVENAIKYNKPDGQVDIDLEKVENDAVITVMDTGLGMEKDKIAHIFEPFYRVDESRSRKIAGSGLGLALVKSIADKHQGQVNAYSEYGRGSTLTMILPQNAAENTGKVAATGKLTACGQQGAF